MYLIEPGISRILSDNTEVVAGLIGTMRVQNSSIELVQAGILLTTLSTIAGLGWVLGLQPLLASADSEVHPTGIPWLQTQSECERTGRTWEDDVCWDSEHDPTF